VCFLHEGKYRIVLNSARLTSQLLQRFQPESGKADMDLWQNKQTAKSA